MKRLQPNNLLAKVVYFLCLCVANSNASLIQLDENYRLEYQFCEGNVDFVLIADNVTGWVGLGFNNKSADMIGSDLIIAGETSRGEIYFGDYHVPSDGENGEPIRDVYNNWAYWVDDDGYTTRIDAGRQLISDDSQQDVPIKNEPIYLIWAYNQYSDDIARPHTHRGSVYVNLLAFGECEYVTDYISPETEAVTDPIPITTEPTPGICPPFGTDLVEHPTSCSLYFVCVEGTAYERECLDGLHFNPSIKACDVPENVNCTKPLPECPPDDVSFHPYPGNCSLYVICAEGTPSVWLCAAETCFDQEYLECRLNDTVSYGTPSHVLVDKGSMSHMEAVARCNQEILQDIILVLNNNSPQEFYVCDGTQYKATFTCPALHKFDAMEQNCVPEL